VQSRPRKQTPPEARSRVAAGFWFFLVLAVAVDDKPMSLVLFGLSRLGSGHSAVIGCGSCLRHWAQPYVGSGCRCSASC
jgi:hypothetical protein